MELAASVGRRGAKDGAAAKPKASRKAKQAATV
jgi:hypothetical protein